MVDATLLAPRQTLVRIATGRDAADTAFLDNHKGAITLDRLVVSALVNGELLPGLDRPTGFDPLRSAANPNTVSSHFR